MQFRALSALFGHMGIELDPVRADAEQQAGFAHYIALYKQLRPLLHHGRAFHIDAEQPGQLIHGVVAEDASTAVVLISQPTLPEYALCGQLRVPGLTPRAGIGLRSGISPTA
ncbi:Alpha-galactosidase [Sodalis praecaptivus]